MNKRVLHFCTGPLFQRTETFIYNLVAGLRSWEPVLAAPERINEKEFPLKGVRFFQVRVGCSGIRGVFDNVLRRHLRWVDPILFRVLNESRASVVHAHFGWSGVRAELACKKKRIPLLVSFYGLDAAIRRGRESDIEQLYEHLFTNAALVCVEGPHLANTVSKLGCPSEKIRILRIAVPVDEIGFRVRDCLDSRRVRLLHCGRFVRKKGLLILLEALADLRRKDCSFELCVIGDGPLRPEIERSILLLELQKSVRLLGPQPRDVFWRELEKCDLLVAPSLSAPNGDSEGGAPTVILEAQSAGVPVVTTNHADIPFVVVPNGSAILADEGSVPSLVNALEKAIGESDRWAEMGHSGREFVSAKHNASVVCLQLESLYDEVTK